jgi:hypothetical protein
MNGSTIPEFDDEDGGARVIDRSGDIDQRPAEERAAPPTGTIVLFKGSARPEPNAVALLTNPVRHPPSALAASQRLPAVPQALAEIAQRLQKDLDKQFAKAKAQLEGLTQKIEVQEKRCIPPKLDDDFQQIRFQRQKVLIANGPVLADHLRDERSRLADLERFKSENRLFREAHYPASPMLGFGILLVLVLTEACINGVLFADSNDQGLFGGWLEAVVLSITNVGAAFLLGRLVLPQIHGRGLFLRAAAITATIAGFAALAVINLFGAHYRDFKAEMARLDLDAGTKTTPKHETSIVLAGPRPAIAGSPAPKPGKPASAEPAPPQPARATERPKEREAIRKILAAPIDLQSFSSFFLLVIGLCGAVVAVCDGYKFDDCFPGYGKRHRRYAEARAKSAEALRRILNQSNAIMAGSFQAMSRKIENHAHEMATLLALHHAYAGDLRALQDGLDEGVRDAEAEIACHDRLVNKVPDRGTFDLYTVAIKPLPMLSETHVKFYETQEKKLKALQKSAQKEQDDGLGVFAAASAGFQKLLAEASQASLQTASLQLPSGNNRS